MFEIQKNIPIPDQQAESFGDLPLNKLEVGDSFEVGDRARFREIYSILKSLNSDGTDRFFVVIKTGGIVELPKLRIWRATLDQYLSRDGADDKDCLEFMLELLSNGGLVTRDILRLQSDDPRCGTRTKRAEILSKYAFLFGRRKKTGVRGGGVIFSQN